MLTAQGSVAVWGGNGGNRWQSLDNSIACVPVLVFVFDCAFILHCVCAWLCCPFTLCFFVCVRLLLCAWDFHSTFWYNSRQLYWLCSLSYVCIWFCFCFHFATWLYSLHFMCFFQILLCSTISFYNDWIAIAVTRLCSSQFPLSSILSTCFSIVLFGRLLMGFKYFFMMISRTICNC